MVMNLITFLTRKNVVSEPVRIGAHKGSGFIKCGQNNAKFRESVRWMHNRRVIAYSRSEFGGWIVMVEGEEAGREWLDPALEKLPVSSEEPDEQYRRFADRLCAEFAEMLRDGIIKAATSPREYERLKGEHMIAISESFFRSDTFGILMPHAEGEEVIDLIHRETMKKLKGRK